MDSEWQDEPKDQPKDQRNAPTPGAQLAAQREALGLTVEQIADQLKLAPRQVAAIESGDYAALPNMAVTRGFVRAYAKVVRLDAAPLVAMIEVPSDTVHEHAQPVRREAIGTTFTESRFPTLTERRQSRIGMLAAGGTVVVLALAVAGAWKAGVIHPAMFSRGDSAAPAAESASAAASAEVQTPLTVTSPNADTAPLQSNTVPLVSVPPQGAATTDAPQAGVNGPAAAPAASPATVTPVATVPTAVPAAAAVPPAAAAVKPAAQPTAATPVATAPAAMPAPVAATPATAAPATAAAAAGGTLVLKVSVDSWVEIRRQGGSPLISRLVKAGSTETFEIKDPALLIVGKPDGVQATLRGAPLELPRVAGGTISRVNIK
ncbi:helix-turn-helix domain-containing protein [Pseudoduganella violacea]|uniref:Cytoskeleton protein RodZ n=1 Tax=Pseudoduganella violacea TaxID=1715466 RepID=A0A7W5FTP9_9BURK|nr:helix-turn-helix domain-containing protein [Pseudoduganella violacea]MBB3118821.1 cytoskeleton protein RodZ [Pseudoduganella violacea]